MNTIKKLPMAILMATLACGVLPRAQAATKGAKSQDSPGWVVIEKN